LWILDAANNVTMEPYRAYVSDRLNKDQHSLGFLTQSAFTGLAQTLAYLAPSIMVWWGMNKDAVGGNHIPQVTLFAFIVGAALSISTVVWSLRKVPELPLTLAEKTEIESRPGGVAATFNDIVVAFKEMPRVMRQLWWMKLFQWYGMMCYWIYIVPSLAKTMFNTADATTEGFRDAGLLNGQIGGFYNFVAFIAAFAMVPVVRKLGPKAVHAFCLLAAAAGMWAIPAIHDKAWLFLPMIGVGLAWGSIMGNPYVLLAGSIPPERAGVYMGIFNMFIVIPMLIQGVTLPLFYQSLLGGQPDNVIRLAGSLLACAAIAVLFVDTRQTSGKAQSVKSA
jgi:maltose/moltooligosaccharide transporter